MKIDITDLHQMMHKTKNIRNMSVIAHVDHGKTTLTDSLVERAGIIASKNAGTARYTDTRADEQERCITIKSTTLSLMHAHKEVKLNKEGTGIERIDENIMINLIDSPGHIDFTSEVTAALRATDGAVIVVDTTKGCQSQTETVLKQAIQEQIKVVLMLNKTDTMLKKMCSKKGRYEDNDDVYHTYNTIIQDINNIIDQQLKEDSRIPEYTKEKVKVDMIGNSVAFGSGKMGWALTMDSAYDFVKRNEKPAADAPEEELLKYYQKKAKTMKLLWGENYINVDTKKWRKTPPKGKEKTSWVRGFTFYVMECLLDVQGLCESGDHDALRKLVNDPDFTFPPDLKELETKVMRKLFPMAEVLMQMIANKLPSPWEAQKYRALTLSTDPDLNGPMSKAIRECDAEGPLVVFCSKKTPKGDLSKPSIVTLGRIMSGTLKANSKVLCLSDKYEMGNPITKEMKGNVQNVMIMIGKMMENVSKMPCGNIIGMTGIDQELPGPGSLVPWPEDNINPYYPVRNMRFTSVAIVGQRVTPKQPKDMDRLLKAARMIQKLDLTAKIEIEDSGVMVFGVGALHVEILVQDLRDVHGAGINVGEQIVNCAETVTSDEPRDAMTKSANHHNRLTCKAHVFGDEITDFTDIITNPDGFTNADLKEKKFELGWGMDNTKINNDNLKRCLYLGDGVCLYNALSGFNYMDEMRQFIIDGLERAKDGGPLCGERIRGVQYCLTDATCHADAIHRGSNQVTPQARNLFIGSILRAGPVLTEPMYVVTVEGPNEQFPSVNKVMNKENAKMNSVEQDDRVTVASYRMSMYSAKDMQPKIMSASSGKFTTCMEFDGYEAIPGSLDDPESQLVKRIALKRIENKLPEVAFGTDHYLDKL